mmetsp:Transcript_1109/g.4499  ORF Transcript_1109/g.4499 Transcript_1109/m.4499 type:complete len:419 (-) Transcript_1109:93-1349(-)
MVVLPPRVHVPPAAQVPVAGVHRPPVHLRDDPRGFPRPRRPVRRRGRLRRARRRRLVGLGSLPPAQRLLVPRVLLLLSLGVLPALIVAHGLDLQRHLLELRHHQRGHAVPHGRKRLGVDVPGILRLAVVRVAVAVGVGVRKLRVGKLGAGSLRPDQSHLALGQVRGLRSRALLAQQEHADRDAKGDPAEAVVRLHRPLEPLRRLRGFARLWDEKLQAVLAVQQVGLVVKQRRDIFDHLLGGELSVSEANQDSQEGVVRTLVVGVDPPDALQQVVAAADRGLVAVRSLGGRILRRVELVRLWKEAVEAVEQIGMSPQEFFNPADHLRGVAPRVLEVPHDLQEGLVDLRLGRLKPGLDRAHVGERILGRFRAHRRSRRRWWRHPGSVSDCAREKRSFFAGLRWQPPKPRECDRCAAAVSL